MNDAKPKLFARYDPFSKYPPLYTRSYEDGTGGILTIRPVWIIGDLILLHDWFGDELKKSNWQLDQHRMAILQHYKQILLSDTAQSFMIEQNKIPVMQVDLLSGFNSGFPASVEFGNTDYIIRYLYKECFRDPGVFKRSMECIIDYIFTYPETGSLYLRLSRTDYTLQELLTSIGFENLVLNNFFGNPLNIFSIRRPGVH